MPMKTGVRCQIKKFISAFASIRVFRGCPFLSSLSPILFPTMEEIDD